MVIYGIQHYVYKFLETPLPLNGGSSVNGTKPLTQATAGVPCTEQRPKDEGK